MIQNNVGEMIFNESDVCNLIMQGREPSTIKNMLVDTTVDIEQALEFLESAPTLIPFHCNPNAHTNVFDQEAQSNWHMPEAYKQLDIAEYILGLCNNEAELQRCGAELLLYQERDLFNLLKYLKYLVDVMIENKVIWGVGRGSSVASYVLYKMGIHRIDSMFYELDPGEFLR